jgi:dephospho-CoA kinase
MQTKYADVHESEWAWAGTLANYTIYNNGSIDDLLEEVNKVWRDLNKTKMKTPELYVV